MTTARDAEDVAPREELRHIRVILRRADLLSPASRRWLIERLRADLEMKQTDG